eukprot:2791591-Prymnesium_polylepis.1
MRQIPLFRRSPYTDDRLEARPIPCDWTAPRPRPSRDAQSSPTRATSGWSGAGRSSPGASHAPPFAAGAAASLRDATSEADARQV